MALSISLIVLYSQLLNLKMEGGSEKGLQFREISPNHMDSVLGVVFILHLSSQTNKQPFPIE